MRLIRFIPVFAAAALLPPAARADSAVSEARKGVRAFKEKKFQEAAESFKKAAELDPTSGLLQYDLGSALAHAGEYEEASGVLDRSLNYDNHPSKRDAWYNLGYSLVKKALAEKQEPAAAPGGPPMPPGLHGPGGDDTKEKLEGLRKGLDAFRQAVLADPSDSKAKLNYETTKAIIREIEKNMPPPQSGGEGKDQKNQDKKDQEKKKQGEKPNPDQEKKDGGENGKDQGEQGGEGGEKKEEEKKDPSKEGEKGGENQSGGDKDKKDGGKKEDSPKQDDGMKPGQTPTPGPPQGKQGEGGEGDPSKPPPTPEQQDALRVLNALAKDNPEQFKKLFKFQGQGRSRKLERDW